MAIYAEKTITFKPAHHVVDARVIDVQALSGVDEHRWQSPFHVLEELSDRMACHLGVAGTLKR
jgi:hypothetical protein